MGQHRCRIFCTKCDQIYNLRRKTVLRHLTGIVRISHTYHALLDSVQKPLGVKCRYVRSHSCMNNHFATSFETLVSQAADGNNLNSRIGCICHIGICTDYNQCRWFPIHITWVFLVLQCCVIISSYYFFKS